MGSSYTNSPNVDLARYHTLVKRVGFKSIGGCYAKTVQNFRVVGLTLHGAFKLYGSGVAQSYTV